jgi:hypothetical protein
MANHSPSAMLIRQPALYGDIKKQIATFWEIDAKLTHNPAPNPVSLNRKALNLLRTQEYVVAEKTDGVRYLLLISKFAAGKRPFAVLVDRAFKMFQIQICAPHYIYKGSLFDGELVWDDEMGCLKFLVFDVVAFGGKSVKTYHLMQRYEIINQAFLSSAEWNKSHIKDYSIAIDTAAGFAVQKKIVCLPEAQHLLFLYSKPCVLFSLFGSLLRSTLSHRSDGYIFTPIKCPVLQNAHSTMFKWKPTPTIDIVVRKGATYFCGDGKDLVELKYAFPEFTFVIEAMNGLLPQNGDDFVIETTITEKQGRQNTFVCIFHRVRVDKKTPNDKRTLGQIIVELRERITIEELITLSETNVSQ